MTLTSTIYACIRDCNHAQAIRFLEDELQAIPDSHAALSLLGYCHYHQGQFEKASSVYKQLTELHPSEDKYHLYYAQSLYKASLFAAAENECLNIKENQAKVENLKASIRYAQDDIPGSKSIWEQSSQENFDADINIGCCLYQEGNYEVALAKFTDALDALGFQPDLVYKCAVCLYQLKFYRQASEKLDMIFEHGARELPEFNMLGSCMEGMELCTIENSQSLKDSHLIEAFNLKAAIEYAVENLDGAKEALNEMPSRVEEELDAVTLHNQALAHIDLDPSSSFRKLNFLLQNPPYPPEAYANLLLLYCKPIYGFYDLAIELMKENPELSSKTLSQDVHNFVEATILSQNSPEEAYEKFSELAIHCGENMRRLTKHIQDLHTAESSDDRHKSMLDYEEMLSKYIPTIMGMTKILWDKEDYVRVEQLLFQSADRCIDHITWGINMGHACFMQECKYEETIHYYEAIIKKVGENVLNVPAIVLANLCVSYIMIGKNEDAEDLMRRVEKEEERADYECKEKQHLHLCTVNLVVGTLYCAKQNFQFGINRIIRSFDPMEKKLEIDTWFYAKRCFIALADSIAKHMIVLKDETYVCIDEFLDCVALHGKNKISQAMPINVLETTSSLSLVKAPALTISQEARAMKRIFFKLRE